MKNISSSDIRVTTKFDYSKLKDSKVKCCYTCEHSGILPSDYYFCTKHHCYLTDEVDYVIDHICDKYEYE